MAETDDEMAKRLFPTALTYPPFSLAPRNADRRLDPKTARLVQRARRDFPAHVILVVG